MGLDRFDRLPTPDDRKFRPLHRESCGFPSPVETLREIGVRDWFAPLCSRAETPSEKRYCVEKDATTLPTMALKVLERRRAGKRRVFDLSVEGVHSFVAGTVGVHNCIGNSGPLPEAVAEAVTRGELVAAAVLSGNRNFEGRINPLVRANYLASPPLVVAYALAGKMDIDLETEPLGSDKNGQPVYLRDVWPTQKEVMEAINSSIRAEMFRKAYEESLEGDERWKRIEAPSGELFQWDSASTYVKRPPCFENMPRQASPLKDIHGARVLAVLGDSVTTDHISPAGSIPIDSPAGKYLIENGVAPTDFNSYGARRGNHEVMMRGTFANVRLRNQIAPGTEGGWTLHQSHPNAAAALGDPAPDGELMTIYDGSMRYQAAGVPLLVLAGKEYGSGSSRDWAAKGTLLLGVRVVIAETFERIHRSNLVNMGVLPLQFT